MIEYHFKVTSFLISLLESNQRVIVAGNGFKHEVFVNFFLKKVKENKEYVYDKKKNRVLYKNGEIVFLDIEKLSLNNLSKKYNYFFCLYYYPELDFLYTKVLNKYWEPNVCFIIGNPSA